MNEMDVSFTSTSGREQLGDQPSSSLCELLAFRDKWVFFSAIEKEMFLMVGENKDKDGKRLKVKGGKREYPAIKAAKLHPNHDHIELVFEGIQRSVAVPRSRITGSNKITSAIVKEYIQTRRLEGLVKAINRVLVVVQRGQQLASISIGNDNQRQSCSTTYASQRSEISVPFVSPVFPPSQTEVTPILEANPESSMRQTCRKGIRAREDSEPRTKKRKASATSWSRASLESCYRGHSPQRKKNLLKEKLTAEGEDKGCQLPIVVASSPSSNSFNVGYLHAYKYEVIAGQHIVQARKEIAQETGKGKDTCTCAIYWGLTEEGKRMLALHNAKLQGVPYDALDVLEKYEELRETMENESEIHASYDEILKGEHREGELFKHHHSYAVIGARHKIDLPSYVLTRKEFLQSFHEPNCWLLSNIRGSRKEELPLHSKLVTLVDLKLESEEGGDDSRRSVERLPGFQPETQIEVEW
ncbi:unnamed protein product [Darwinula stevensoni]|uniref:Uncharacterized protein n=1 Tax=Darwinula stevensoni TaxID=69355 RepID=A0A7R8XFV1_9CRUS|nr:unnamed protein product [Darwinula stevensoni]CAG0895887.1 unnamed protein product [Darwinula stevensoni]